MAKLLLTIILSLLLALPLAAQQGAGESEVASEAGVAAADGTDTTDETTSPDEPEASDEAVAAEQPEQIIDPDFADTELDVQTYEEDDDDFVPSEEIPADEPIPFPSNI